MNAHELNLAIEDRIRSKDARGESFSQEDIAFIRRYSGAGGKIKQGAKGEGILSEYYTPSWLANYMWEFAKHYGFPEDGTVLEPACGIGRLIEHAPNYHNVTAFEINPMSARIAELLYPGATIHTEEKGLFETAFMEDPNFRSRLSGAKTWLTKAPFDLVIGNPPYGQHKSFYSGFFKKPKIRQVEHFFLYYGLKLLKPGGLLIYLTTTNWLRTGINYQAIKADVIREAELIDAYHLPPVIEDTNVPLDILIYRKR